MMTSQRMNGAGPRLRLGLLAGLAVLVAAACGGDNSSGNAGAGAGSTVSSGTQDTSNSSGSNSGGGTVTSSNGSGASGGGTVLVGDLSDSFDGDGALIDYTTNNPNALPEVERIGGRYRANLVDNTNDITLHYHQAQGRLDAKLISFPFDVIVRNIGIGTQANSQNAPSASGEKYLFAGVQVHVPDLDSRNSSHVVVGHRGNQYFTVEGKNTVNGNSSVNDAGGNIVPSGRADIRIVGNPDYTLTVSWQTPNPAPGVQADAWTLYNGTGVLPGQPPAYGNTVFVGLITYAFGYNGVPFVGTADSIEGGTLR